MKVFEFHFNPKAKEDLVFDSFCYEPENIYEKKLGSLFLVGELKNALPQNLRFLDNFVSFFKRGYYSAPNKFSPEASLKLSLKKANEYLEKIAKSGDVSWLGNLNLAILSVKNFNLNFTKISEMKILLLRQGQIIDLGKNLEFEGIEPYPLKIFGNIVSGKLAEQDEVLVMTKELFNFFLTQNLLRKIAQLYPFDEKKLKGILKAKGKELLKVSGVCLLLLCSRETWLEKEKPRVFTFQLRTEKFSFKKVFSPLLNIFSKPKLFFSNFLSNLNFYPRGKKFKLTNLIQKSQKSKEIKLNASLYSAPSAKLKVKPARNWKFQSPLKLPKINIKNGLPLKLPSLFNKNIILLSSLIFILVLGFFIFKIQEHSRLKEFQSALFAIRENILQAENYLALNNETKAFSIYKEAWQQILPLSKEKSAQRNEAVSLKNSIEESLEKISKLEKIQDPKLFFEFDKKEFIPQKMVFFQNNLYFFSPLVNNLYQLNSIGEKNILAIDQTFNEGVIYGRQLLFFQKPNLIFFLKNGDFGQPIFLTLPYSDFDAKTFAVYNSSLYFLDTKRGEIIKYSYPLTENKDFPQYWLSEETEKMTNAKSIAIDGPIWILNKNNTISQYYGGIFRKTMTLDFFPQPENLSSITTLYGLFYLLEPSQKRLIIMTESGKMVKQFQSEKFDNLKDFAVSDNGNTIWFLNGVKVYEVNF